MGGKTPGCPLTDDDSRLISELRNRRRTETEHQLMMMVFKLSDAVKSERNAALDAAKGAFADDKVFPSFSRVIVRTELEGLKA